MGAVDVMARHPAGSTASPELADRMVLYLDRSEQRVRDTLIAKRQPTHERHQKGKFGEVLHTAILEKFEGMDILVNRYRYHSTPNAPLHGLDIVALDGRGDDERIVFAETKLCNANGASAIVDAHAQVARIAGESLPSQLVAYMETLRGFDEGLLGRLLRAVERGHQAHFHIGAIVEASMWSDSHLDAVSRMQAGSDLDVAIDVVTIGMLGDLVRESHLRVGTRD